MRTLLAFGLLLSAPLTLTGQDRYRAAVEIGVVDSVWSATLDEHRPYLVYTPPSYSDTTTIPHHYPVLYLLDGNAHFHSVSGLVQILGTGVNGTFAIPEMIVVAIPNTDRTRDLTPTKAAAGPDGVANSFFETSGGNGAFFEFVRTELMPHIEGRYRTMPYRVLIGHSFGGIAALNALYTIPDAFDAYVAIDPSLWWDDNTLLHRAKPYFESARLRGKALYVAQANTLQPTDTTVNAHFSAITQFDAIMDTYNRSGIRYAFQYYPDDSHGSVPLVAEYDALRFIFESYDVPLQRILAEPSLLTEHFRDISEQLGKTFEPSEGMMRLLGQVALGQDTTAAIALAEMRVSLYPESHRAHEFLGDIWAAREDHARARRHFEEALRHAPGHDGLEEKLRALGSGPGK